MNFSVVWTRTAEAQLAELWLSSTRREAVTLSAQAIDHHLRTRPLEVGESRELGRRVLLAPPLGAIYRVQASDLTVRGLRIWEFKSRAP